MILLYEEHPVTFVTYNQPIIKKKELKVQLKQFSIFQKAVHVNTPVCPVCILC